jgi:C4-dicarboxylate-specific signal transduction histidine kinase
MPERPRLLTEKLAFFGAITASLSHELKNVLATIKEFSGLLEDLVQASAAGRPPSTERLQTFCDRINKQVGRGSALIERLNRFAHSVDEPEVSVGVKQVLTEICSICDRFARLKQATLARRFADEEVTLRSDPFAIQHVIYLCIKAALEAANEQRRVTVVFEVIGEGCDVAVESDDPLGELGQELVEGELMRLLVEDLGAQLTRGSVSGRDRLVLSWR